MTKSAERIRVSRPTHDQSGSAVLLILAVLISLGVIIEIGVTQTVQDRNSLIASRTLGVRNGLAAKIHELSIQGASFRNSVDSSLGASINLELKNCLFGSSSSPCQAGVENPLALYHPVSQNSGESALEKLSGPSAQSAKYDLRGRLCTTNSGSPATLCAFEVSTTFIAHCPGGISACPVADSFSVHSLVRSLITEKSLSAMADIELVSANVPRSEILPRLNNSSTPPVVVSLLSTQTVETTPPTPLATLNDVFEKQGITDPQLISTYSSLISGVSDPLMGAGILGSLLEKNDPTLLNASYIQRAATILEEANLAPSCAGNNACLEMYWAVTNGFNDFTDPGVMALLARSNTVSSMVAHIAVDAALTSDQIVNLQFLLMENNISTFADENRAGIQAIVTQHITDPTLAVATVVQLGGHISIPGTETTTTPGTAGTVLTTGSTSSTVVANSTPTPAEITMIQSCTRDRLQCAFPSY